MAAKSSLFNAVGLADHRRERIRLASRNDPAADSGSGQHNTNTTATEGAQAFFA
jgi:hypothetical protein